MVDEKILYISELLLLRRKRTLQPEEQTTLEDWIGANPANRALLQQLADEEWVNEGLLAFQQYDAVRSRQQLEERLQGSNLSDAGIHHAHFLKMVWLRYAAAVIILFGIGAYLWDTQNVKRKTANVQSVPVNNDVLPGSDKAILTLSNGEKIVLTPATQQTITDGQLAIDNQDGKLVYGKTDIVVYNTLSTPKGGQYKLVLPDGTDVWLNAASFISYPTAFAGKERNVMISGEAYFEVAKDKSRPFHVKVGDMEVEVLGTHFNINSYADEGSMEATLLEGRIKVSRRMVTSNESLPNLPSDKTSLQPLSNGISEPGFQSVILQPGQQAIAVPTSRLPTLKIGQPPQSSNVVQYTQQPLTIVNHPDLDQVMAWKNGLFNFTGADLKSVMKQLERWYDIEVKYQGAAPNIIFQGKMDRGVNLSEVLEVLTKMGVKFKREGRVLIVTQ